MSSRKKLRPDTLHRPDLLSDLPDDILLFILTKLSASASSPSDFFTVLATCKRMNRLGMSPAVLRELSGNAMAVKARSWSEISHRFLRKCVQAGNVEGHYLLDPILLPRNLRQRSVVDGEGSYAEPRAVALLTRADSSQRRPEIQGRQGCPSRRRSLRPSRLSRLDRRHLRARPLSYKRLRRPPRPQPRTAAFSPSRPPRAARFKILRFGRGAAPTRRRAPLPARVV